MEKFNKLYDKIHPSSYAFIGIFIFLCGLLPAIFVHPDFSFLSTKISDLGAPTNILYIYFDICWFITGIFMIFFLYGFTKYLQLKGFNTKQIWIVFIFGVLSAVGILGLAIFNTEQFHSLHYISELLFFFTGIIYLFAYAYLEWKSAEFPKYQAIFNLIVVFFFILYLILLVVNRAADDIVPEFQTVAEWLFLFFNLAWFVENGAFIRAN